MSLGADINGLISAINTESHKAEYEAEKAKREAERMRQSINRVARQEEMWDRGVENQWQIGQLKDKVDHLERQVNELRALIYQQNGITPAVPAGPLNYVPGSIL